MKANLYAQRIGVTESGASIYLITRYDSTAAADYNAYSAKRALWEFANKQFPDTFKGKMTFDDGAQFGGFASGMTGFGGIIDKKGNAEMQSLKLRGFLEVPELRYNRVEISMGDTWYAPSAGIIESVDTTAQTINPQARRRRDRKSSGRGYMYGHLPQFEHFGECKRGL